MSVQTFKPKPPPQKSPVNLKIQKETPKVVNMVDIEDLGEKVTYCRCWRSKKVEKTDYIMFIVVKKELASITPLKLEISFSLSTLKRQF